MLFDVSGAPEPEIPEMDNFNPNFYRERDIPPEPEIQQEPKLENFLQSDPDMNHLRNPPPEVKRKPVPDLESPPLAIEPPPIVPAIEMPEPEPDPDIYEGQQDTLQGVIDAEGLPDDFTALPDSPVLTAQDDADDSFLASIDLEAETVVSDFIAPKPRPARKSVFKGSYAEDQDQDLRQAYSESKRLGHDLSIDEIRETFPDAPGSVFDDSQSIRADFDTAPHDSLSRPTEYPISEHSMGDEDEPLLQPRSLTRSPPPRLEPETDAEIPRVQLPSPSPPGSPSSVQLVQPRKTKWGTAILVAGAFFFLASQAT